MTTQPLAHPAEAARRPIERTRSQRIVRRSLFTLAGLLGLLFVALAVIYVGSQVRLNRRYDIAVQPLPIPTDAASIARGQHLATAVSGCTDCHGADLSGHTFADAPPFALFGLSTQPAIFLGSDLLSSFRRVALDFGNRKVRFTMR